jgi:hypothetical protein
MIDISDGYLHLVDDEDFKASKVLRSETGQTGTGQNVAAWSTRTQP